MHEPIKWFQGSWTEFTWQFLPAPNNIESEITLINMAHVPCLYSKTNQIHACQEQKFPDGLDWLAGSVGYCNMG